MNLKNKFAVLAGSALIVGGLLTGAAFAATPSPEAAAERAARIEQAVADGKISQSVADLMLQLGNLRQAAMEKLDTDSKALVDQTVAAGETTQEQADKILMRRGPPGNGR